MRIAVINCSKKQYNLGAHKLVDWLTEQEGNRVEYWDGDPGLWGYTAELVALSVVFSWHAPLARDIALRYKPHADIWCGGPGMTALEHWWERETGLKLVKGLDPRFDKQRGNYKMTFASRGCPVGCSFCLVPTLEGRQQQLDWDFVPAPILGDNNLSALPVEFQEHIISRYKETKTILRDANSGFEPSTFDAATYRRWKPLLRGPWRFAFDEIGEEREVRDMMALLSSERPHRKQVYCLIGNEPISSCLERARKIIEWGGEPFCQPILPLNYLGGSITPKYDWTYQKARDLSRYFNRHLWRKLEIEEYRPRKRGAAPFSA